jgi:hypothetical protein
LLTCMAPKRILHYIVLVQLKFVIELQVVILAFIEESLQFLDLINCLFSN